MHWYRVDWNDVWPRHFDGYAKPRKLQQIKKHSKREKLFEKNKKN